MILNLDKKLKIIERAEELAQDTDVMRAFRELQELHKMWKEELGPVDREHREAIWQRFKTSTKIINDKRQAYYQEIDKSHEKNLEIKLDIINKINDINNQETKSHGAWQNKIKAIETLRNDFFNAGKVPIKVNGLNLKLPLEHSTDKKTRFIKASKKINLLIFRKNWSL